VFVVSTLTESQSLELARLDVLYEAGRLAEPERTRWRLLKTGNRPTTTGSLGTRAALSPGLKGLAVKALKAGKNGTAVPITGDVPLADLNGTETKTLLRQGSATSVGAFQSLDTSRQYEPTRRPLELLDLVRLGTTEEAAVPYMRQTTYTPAAVEVAEATSTTTGTKPEATLPFEAVSSPVESISSWVPATTRALGDVDELRGIVDEQLLYDARRRLEAQVLAGNGTSPNLRGLDNTTGVLTQAKGADSVPLALAKGIAQVIAAGYTPTAVALHPDDWVDGVTVILANGGSSLGDVLEVPVVKTASVAAGTGYVGAWGQLVVWLRSTDVFVSRTHSDFLARNLAAILAEIRAGVGVLAPAAFCRVTGI
jgi:Phage capsid family